MDIITQKNWPFIEENEQRILKRLAKARIISETLMICSLITAVVVGPAIIRDPSWILVTVFLMFGATAVAACITSVTINRTVGHILGKVAQSVQNQQELTLIQTVTDVAELRKFQQEFPDIKSLCVRQETANPHHLVVHMYEAVSGDLRYIADAFVESGGYQGTLHRVRGRQVVVQSKLEPSGPSGSRTMILFGILRTYYLKEGTATA